MLLLERSLVYTTQTMRIAMERTQGHKKPRSLMSTERPVRNPVAFAWGIWGSNDLEFLFQDPPRLIKLSQTGHSVYVHGI